MNFGLDSEMKTEDEVKMGEEETEYEVKMEVEETSLQVNKDHENGVKGT